MFCSKCGKEIDQEGGFCPQCGAKIGEHTIVENKSFIYFRPRKHFGQWLLRKATIAIDSQKVTTKIKETVKLEVSSKTAEVSCYSNYLGKTGIATQSFTFESGKSYIVDYQSPLLVFSKGKISINTAEPSIEEKFLRHNKNHSFIKIFASIVAIILLLIVAISSCTPNSDSNTADSTNNQSNKQTEIADHDVPIAVDAYKWIDKNDTLDDYEISSKSLQFIFEHPDFFPGNDSNSGAISDIVNFDLEYKYISKTPEKYNDTLINIIGTVIDCEELNTPYGTVTYVHISEDDTYNNFCLYYLGEIEIFEDDWLYVYALPFDIVTFENMSGAYTEAVVGAASFITPAGID